MLDLSQNSLNSVRLGIFLPRPADRPCQLVNLLVLNIAENDIQILSEQDLRPFPALRQLNLFNNKLVEVKFRKNILLGQKEQFTNLSRSLSSKKRPFGLG